jgi:DNA repair protein RadA/Sms
MVLARKSMTYACQSCGAIYSKWAGQCVSCNEWNSLVEEQLSESAPKGLSKGKGRWVEFVGLKGTTERPPRSISGINEFDRVTGGGLVPGSATLVGGDPGIGKSTLLMQVTAALTKTIPCAYISGEESIDQLRMRAERLGLAETPVQLATATSVRDIVTTLDDIKTPGLVIIDSIQCMYIDSLDSAPGTVSQVRSSAQELIRISKRRGFALILVGHVTKDGTIAGPRVLEHMVDTVLYFEGDQSHQFRIMRAVKNRFGASDEIGVFEMTEKGLAEVPNPSALFLSERNSKVTGSSVFAGIGGTRTVLVEIQCLIAPTSQATPRRAVIGWDIGRLAMVMAVLDARCGLALGGAEVYLNVAGGMKISEPAADLAVAAALVSSLGGTPVPSETVIFGEIGLSGEVRAVSQMGARLKEAEKLGFTKAIIPAWKKNPGKTPAYNGTLKIIEIGHLNDLVFLLPEKTPTKPDINAHSHLVKGRVQNG